MFFQIVLGTGITLLTVVAAALGFWAAEGLVTLAGRWLVRPPHAVKLAATLMVAVTIVMMALSVSVWIWALALMGQRSF